MLYSYLHMSLILFALLCPSLGLMFGLEDSHRVVLTSRHNISVVCPVHTHYSVFVTQHVEKRDFGTEIANMKCDIIIPFVMQLEGIMESRTNVVDTRSSKP